MTSDSREPLAFGATRAGALLLVATALIAASVFLGLFGILSILVIPALLIFLAARPADAQRVPSVIGRRLAITLPFTLLVLAVVAAGVAHVAVWNPLAKVPQLRLEQIYRALDDAGETPAWQFLVGWAVLWALAALALPVLAVTTRGHAWMSTRRICVAGLLLVGGVAGTVWFAGFNHGMSIADAFATSGGDAAASGPLIMALGGIAVVIALFVAVLPRRPSANSASPGRADRHAARARAASACALPTG